ncbi:hypothetical protein OG589_14665 [Sphaerisporangium sp. NBC_01403]|uniref:hypothetical protein n=1 Tax=Sphaerisporangium sp. NBC_01403 TaxID=2903599 RepID=UPI00325005A5
MPEIPPQAAAPIDVPDAWVLAAAVDAYNDGRPHLDDYDADARDFLADAIAAVLPLAAAHVARLIEAACPTPMDPHRDPCPHMEDARVAREAFTAGERSGATTVQTAPESTETASGRTPGIIGREDD